MKLLWVVVAGIPTIGHSACLGSGTPLFRCEIEESAKAVDVCLQDDVAIYRYGPVDATPEMILARRVEDVGMIPWNGIGRWLNEAMAFSNGTTDYEVSYGIDRLSEPAVVEAQLVVQQSGNEIARLACDPETITGADFSPLYDAKEAVGQGWCTDAGEWRDVCAE